MKGAILLLHLGNSVTNNLIDENLNFCHQYYK